MDEWNGGRPEALAKAAATTRDDYKELAELTQRPLRGEVPTTFRPKPGDSPLREMDWRRRSTAQDDDVKNESNSRPRNCVSLQEMSVSSSNIRPCAFEAPWPQTRLQRSHSFHDLHKYRELNSKILGGHGEDLQAALCVLGTGPGGLPCSSDKSHDEEKTKMVEKLAIDKDLDKKRWTTAPQDPSSVTLRTLSPKESLFSSRN
ncbi:hypothetical protein GWK47_024913 [Chionoecetes opilio]|uniref:Uncharacterized protein n=1 Tax=Chionoecetes opilio TaxID=41210 RepID=A0A8J4XKQ3_CHIOP|nr:hypothetical protein GWK47_024913 [Chionoecetes opilio]